MRDKEPMPFAAFMQAVHERRPFPWQEALADFVAGEGVWPAVIDVPTGLGKTSVIDVAVWSRAVLGDAAPRRIFFVVDRQLIVDDAAQHAEKIAAAVADAAPDSPLAALADRLRPIPVAGLEKTQPELDLRPLTVTRMRGGTTWDRQWITRPDQCAVITGTVDQVGSRLLFRGYGVSETGRPIDAALCGTDSLIIVDEAHLSEPFHTTVETALDLDQPKQRLFPEPQMVRMSATNADTDLPTLRISDADRHDAQAGKRLSAAKQLVLIDVSKKHLSAALSQSAVELAVPGRVVLAVVNTVAGARDVFEAVQSQLGESDATPRTERSAWLLTGKVREADRQAITDELYPRIKSGRTTGTTEGPIVLVATQTVEVGLDIDADVLVTEAASWEALVQRLGRLNRLGERPWAKAIVICDGDKDAPVYGPARQAAWDYLCACADAKPATWNRKTAAASLPVAAEVSPMWLRTKTADVPPGVFRADKPIIPVLDAATLSEWVRTSPAPVPETAVAPFLHGIEQAPAKVTVVWRCDLDHPNPTKQGGQATRTPRPDGEWAEIVSRLPPVSSEGIELSLWAVKAWLTGEVEPKASLSDLDNEAEPKPVRSDKPGRKVLVYRETESRTVPASRIPPGALIVVPASYGGCDQFGWNPLSHKPVLDVADLAPTRTRQTLRLGYPLHQLATELDTRYGTHLRSHLTGLVDKPEKVNPDTILGHLEKLTEYCAARAESTPGIISRLCKLGSEASVTPWSAADPVDEEIETAHGWRPPWWAMITAGGLNDDQLEAASSATGEQITLQSHQGAVARRIRHYAGPMTKLDRLVGILEKAGRWHDEGKRDLRFQAMLLGGDRFRAELLDETTLLAKSGMDSADRGVFKRARALSGYPRGARHEALSARIARSREGTGPDADLMVHLIASHHGHARPLLPPTLDNANLVVEVPDCGSVPASAPVDLGHAAVFERLNREFGYWGLAMLETILRLADQTASRYHEETKDQP